MVEVLLASLREAERLGQSARAIELRAEILALRLGGLSSAELPSHLSKGDCALLFNQARDLRALGRFPEALEVLDEAQRYAGLLGDLHQEQLLGLHAVHCCLEGLSESAALLTEAGRRLTMLGIEVPGNPAAARAAVEALGTPRSGPRNRTALRLEGFYALGRYQAATGALGEADRTFSRALSEPGVRQVESVRGDEILVWLHEVRLDRGDFAGCDALRQVQRDEPENPLTVPMGATAQLKWQVLGAMLLRLRTRLTEAEQVLALALADPSVRADSPVMQRTWRGAKWQRLHVLSGLNRLGEAEALLRELAEATGVAAEDLRQLVALYAAHRLGEVREIYPSVREIISPNPRKSAADPSPLRDPTDPPLALHRTRERVVDEWARVANGVLLDLHHGRLAQARQRFEWLAEFSRTVDSALCAARQDHLLALLHYYEGDADKSAVLADKALAAYQKLGMLAEQWSVQRLRLWILERRGGLEAERAPFLQHEQALLGEINRHLSATDQRLFQLNKWSEQDRQLDHGYQALWRSLNRLDGARLFCQRRRERRIRRTLQKILRLREQNLGPARGLRSLWSGTLPEGEVALYYVVLPARLLVFRLVGAHWEVFAVPTSRIDLWEACRRALTELYYKSWSDPRLTEALAMLAAKLGLEQALAGLPESPLDKPRRLYIIPDDMLFLVPFAALPVLGVPLLARFAPALVPHWEWRSGPSGCFLPIARALGIAVPHTQACTAAGAPLPDRPQVAEGLEAIKQAAQPDGLRLLTGAPGCASTRAAVLLHLPQAQVAQYAGHSDADPQAPESSGLALQDGWLTVADLSGVPLEGLDLAVFSSCFGGSVQLSPGRALVGLPLTMLNQGTRAVIAALWQVNADFNPAFSRELFRHLKDHGPIEAVRLAQAALFAENPPRDWASYVIYHSGLVPAGPMRHVVALVERFRRGRKRLVLPPNGA